MTTRQKELLALVRENPGQTTAKLRRLGGYRHQGYETTLRDRLYRLTVHGGVRYEETGAQVWASGPDAGRTIRCTARRWFPT